MDGDTHTERDLWTFCTQGQRNFVTCGNEQTSHLVALGHHEMYYSERRNPCVNTLSTPSIRSVPYFYLKAHYQMQQFSLVRTMCDV